MNPYADTNFFQFFGLLASRLIGFLGGADLSIQSDEIQLITLLFVALSCSLIGTFLWLKKMTMLTNAISHTILAGIASVFFIEYMAGATELSLVEPLQHEGYVIVAALIAALVTVISSQFLTLKIGIKEDVAVGVVFTFLFSVGVILLTLFFKNAHIGAELLMGNADALAMRDLKMQLNLFIANLCFVLCFYRLLATCCFDALFAALSGFRPALVSYALMAAVAVTSVVSFRAVGVMLVLVFLVLPSLIARRFTNKLKTLLVLSNLVGMASVVVGVALSRHLFSLYTAAVSTSALIALLMCLAYLVALLIRRPA